MRSAIERTNLSNVEVTSGGVRMHKEERQEAADRPKNEDVVRGQVLVCVWSVLVWDWLLSCLPKFL